MTKSLFLYYIGPIANVYNFCITDVKKGLAGVGLISFDERIGVPLLEKGKRTVVCSGACQYMYC